jgi:peptidoglycan hydrolase-like protein with peptidoglycan-binding domain
MDLRSAVFLYERRAPACEYSEWVMKIIQRSPQFLLAAAVGAALAISSVHANEPAQSSLAVQQATVGSAQLYASPSQVMLVQQKLSADGRKPGEEGRWDDATQREVRDYQKAHGLAPTGQLDTSLLSALDIGDVLEGQSDTGHFLDGLLRRDTADTDGKPAATADRGTRIFVSPTHVAQIQHLLHEQGFYKGEEDGVWGEGTAAAANQYRMKHGLEASSGLDVALLRAMNAEKAPVPKLAPAATQRSTGVPLQAGPTALRALQKELTAQGIQAGNIDGEWGQNTQNAVREFQRKHELETTGTLTLPTLAALGIDIANSKASFEAREAGSDRAKEPSPPDAVATTEEDER